MKIVFAILALLCATSGWANHKLLTSYCTPRYFKNTFVIICIYCCVLTAYLLSLISFGMIWYWSLIITIPAVFIITEIYGSIKSRALMLGSDTVVVKAILGLIFSIIAVCL